jgi:hypothetical protein
MAAGPADGEAALLAILEERTRGIMPEYFAVERSDVSLKITGIEAFARRSTFWTPIFVLRSRLPAEERLNIIFRSYAQHVQQFLTKASRTPWPAKDAAPHVDVSEDAILVWWGGDAWDEAVAHIPPVLRKDLGI